MTRIIALIMLVLTGLTPFAQTVTINGHLKNAGSSKEIIVMEAYSQRYITAVPLGNNGNFNVSFPLSTTDYIYLGPNENDVVLIIPAPGEVITLQLDLENMMHPQIEGSPLSAKLYELMDANDFYDAKSDSIYKAADSAARKLEEERSMHFRKSFSAQEPHLAQLVFMDVLDPVQDSALFRDIVEALYKTHPDNPLVGDYMNELEATSSSITSGSIPPEINLPDPDGKKIALSSLKGKYVLVDFWATWCGPCKEEIPNLVEAYTKFKDKGFEIYSVSLDRDRKAWTDGIAKYKMNWIHVSDLRFWENEAALDWNITAIPAAYLLDREGKVITSDLRGDKLIEKLSELMK